MIKLPVSPLFLLLSVFSLLLLASPALADWGEPWGTMIWGLPVAVPTLPGVGLIVLALLFSGSAAWLLRKRRGLVGLPVLVVLLSIPLVVAAGTVTVPNTFVNGTPADADQVNANFDAVETAVNDNDSRITTLETTLPLKGDAGEPGATGPEGAQGPIGLTGATGAQGEQGPIGLTGATGPEGAQGPIGLTGVTGPQGDPGAAGTDHTAEIAALQAQVAALIAGGLRFLACADGLTVADAATGLLWERKTGTAGSGTTTSVICETAPGGCPGPARCK